MAFNLRNFNAITGSLINRVTSTTTRTTDFNVGSVLRTILEAVAIVLEDLYINIWQGLLDAIETAVYKGFDFKRLQPTAASGIETFTTSVAAVAAIVIPQGTLLRVPGTTKEYTTTVVGQIDIGQTEAFIRIQATVTGTISNTIPSSVTELDASISGISSVTNESAFRSGSDLETQLERRDRFRRFIVSLARSNKEGVEFAARSAVIEDSNGIVIESVTDALVYEEFLTDATAPAGFFEVFIYNGQGGTTAELVAEAQKIIDGFTDDSGEKIAGYRAAGVLATVKFAEEITVNVDADVSFETNFSLSELQDTIEDAITTVFESSSIGDSVLINDIICAIKNVAGVFDVTMNSPTANVTVLFNQVGILGTITLTEVTA